MRPQMGQTLVKRSRFRRPTGTSELRLQFGGDVARKG